MKTKKLKLLQKKPDASYREHLRKGGAVSLERLLAESEWELARLRKKSK